MLRQGNRMLKRDGFTLVEVIIASSLFFVIAGTFVASTISSMRTHKMATDLYRATCIARNRIQRARTLDFGSLPLLAEDEVAVDESGNVFVDGGFRRTTIVSNTVPTCSRIVVKVWFPVAHGKLSPRSVDVSTMVTEGM